MKQQVNKGADVIIERSLLLAKIKTISVVHKIIYSDFPFYINKFLKIKFSKKKKKLISPL